MVDSVWGIICGSLRKFTTLEANARDDLGKVVETKLSDDVIRAVNRMYDTVLGQIIELVRVVILSKPEWNLKLPTDLEEIVWTVRISPLAYLRAMCNMFWSAIRHPLSSTTIDLTTGRVLYRA